MSSNFNPDEFMVQNMDQPLETERRICPEGEFSAMIDDFDSKAFEQIDFTYKQGERAGLPGTMTKFTVPFVINDAKAVAEAGMGSPPRVRVDKQVILDFIGDTTQLDFGPNKNIDLGRVRDAVRQNSAGNWNCSMLRGAGPCMVKVVHRTFQRKDGTQGKRAEVDRVVRIA